MVEAVHAEINNSTISKRYDFVLLFDVTDGNPNGDPDAGNMPRIDPQSLQGLVTDGCLKRKIRNAIAAKQVDNEGKILSGYDLYFQTQDAVYEKRILNLLHQRAYQEAPADVKKKGKEKVAEIGKARKWMCSNFFDIRTFGAVMTTGEGEERNNCGQVRGPVQITFARSIDPIVPLEFAITRKSITKESDAEKEIKEKGTLTGTMGRKNTVPYGLYRCYGFINPFLAKDTGFNDDDLELLWDALKGLMWDIDRSAARGLMSTRGLYVFEHGSKLGNAPAHELFDRIKVMALGADKVPRSFNDYKSNITIDADKLPAGVTLHRMVS
jgi:CRISPR-associated protein Csd2